MRLSRALIVAACTTVVTGCVRSEAAFETYRQSLVNDRAAYDKELTTCVKHLQNNPKYLENYSVLIQKPKEQTPSVVCARLLDALRDGALSYKDYMDAAKGVTTPKLIRVVQGR